MDFKWALQGEKDVFEDALQVRKSVFIEEQGVDVQRDLDGEDENAYHLVGYLEGQPITCARLQRENGQLTIQRVAVIKSYRGQLYGQALMQEIEAWAQANHIDQLILSSQISSLPFYEKLGYQLASAPYEDAGIPHQKMVKNIKYTKNTYY